MTGLVLKTKTVGCRGLVDRVEALNLKTVKPDCICGSKMAGAIAILMAHAVKISDIPRAIEAAIAFEDIDRASEFFEELLAVGGEPDGFCVPIIDTLSLAQFSYTNIPSLFSGKIEEGLSKGISPAVVAASGLYGICPGFEYAGRNYSAGRENTDFCFNCMKRMGYFPILLEG